MLRNSSTPLRPYAFHRAYSPRLILLHLFHCENALGGRHHRPKRRECHSAREIPDSSVSERDTFRPPVSCVSHLDSLVFRPDLHHRSVLACLCFQTIALYSCRFRAVKNSRLIVRFEGSCLAFIPES